MKPVAAHLFIEVYFQSCKSDMCFDWKRYGKDIVAFNVYVVDLLATRTNAAAVDPFINSLSSLYI